MRRYLIIILLVGIQVGSFAQQTALSMVDSVFVLPDSVRAFSLSNLYDIVLANHPVLKQANLLQENARQQLRAARGAFDPKLEASWDGKQFKGTEYYDILNASLKVPLWFPIDPKIGVERNRGVFLNPERFISDDTRNRQVVAGVNVPLGKGLFIDARRATVRQAQLFQEMAEAEKIKVINKILLQATKDYWNWYYNYYNYRLLNQSIQIAEEIFRRVKLDYEYGEMAVIDTIQAKITLQQRQIDMQEALTGFLRSGLVLSNYLWGENEEPLELSPSTAPVFGDGLVALPDEEALKRLLSVAQENHPELRKLRLKTGQLEIENRLNRENLKPRMDLSYNFIDAPLAPGGETEGVSFDDNYKFGVNFSFPLFLRKERSKIQQTNIKIIQNNYEADLRTREITNEINGIFIEMTNTRNILDQLQGMVGNYKRLVQAELLNLENGESDLFKINIQQDKLIESQKKMLKAQANFEKSKAELLWAAGVENLDYQPE